MNDESIHSTSKGSPPQLLTAVKLIAGRIPDRLAEQQTPRSAGSPRVVYQSFFPSSSIDHRLFVVLLLLQVANLLLGDLGSYLLLLYWWLLAQPGQAPLC